MFLLRHMVYSAVNNFKSRKKTVIFLTAFLFFIIIKSRQSRLILTAPQPYGKIEHFNIPLS
jgi:hypothetical protein